MRNLLLILAVMLCSCITDSAEPATELVSVGQPLPRFTATLIDGKQFSTAEMLGTEWVLVLFSPECADCRKLLPLIETRYCEDTSTPIICIARGCSTQQAADYWQSQSFTMSCAADPDRSIFNLFALEGVPRVYVVSADGLIARAYFLSGFASEAEDAVPKSFAR